MHHDKNRTALYVERSFQDTDIVEDRCISLFMFSELPQTCVIRTQGDKEVV